MFNIMGTRPFKGGNRDATVGGMGWKGSFHGRNMARGCFMGGQGHFVGRRGHFVSRRVCHFVGGKCSVVSRQGF